MSLLVKETPTVVANKWENDPTAIYIPGLDQDFPPEQTLELAVALVEKARLALSGKCDAHYDAYGEEIN